MNNKKHDTEPDLLRAGEGRDTSNEELAALHRDLDRQLVRKKLALQNKAPVSYAETAETNGQEGARWFVAHDVPKPTEHQTIPEGRVILSTTPAPDPTTPPIQETTDPMPPPSSGMVLAAPNVTQPMRDLSRSMPTQRMTRVNRADENTVPDELGASPWRFTSKWLVAIAAGVVVATALLFVIIKVWPAMSSATSQSNAGLSSQAGASKPAPSPEGARVAAPIPSVDVSAVVVPASAASVSSSTGSAIAPVATTPPTRPQSRPVASGTAVAAPSPPQKPPASKHGAMLEEEK